MRRSQPPARDPRVLSKEDLRDKENLLKCYYDEKNRCPFLFRIYNLVVSNYTQAKPFVEIPV